MLAFQTMNTKRRREDDSDSEDERYLKKSRPWAIQHNHGSQQYPSPSNLPLRPSVTPSPPQGVPGLEAMTPAQSEHSEANSPASIQDEPLFLSSQHNSMDYDMQMDEDDLDIVGSQPPDSPFITTNFRPAKLNADLFSRDSPNNITGRIPTPIYPNFHTGGVNGLGYPSSGLAGGMSMSNGFLGVPSHQPPIMQPPPRKQNSQGDQDRSRRMPSPISEDEDIPDTPTALTQSQLERLSVTSHVGSHDRMDADMAPPLIPSPPARGRKRSGALTGTGRFSMGYRDDCEKCRQRVPGHYSHFLP